jgi:hypothetical protein
VLESVGTTHELAGAGIIAGMVGAALVIIPHCWSLFIRPSSLAPAAATCGWCLLVLAGLAGNEIPGYRITMLGSGAAGLSFSLLTKFTGLKLRDLVCVATACGVLSFASQSWNLAFARIDESELASSYVSMTIEWKPSGEAYATTDRGTRLTLHVPAKPDFTPQGISNYEPSVAFDTTEVSGVDLRSNCHGFAFAGGQFLIAGEDVMAILSDNGYERVSEPRSGDIAIYFEANSPVPEHTGIVRKVGSGEILVESKWGIGKRYLHRVLDQPYGQRVEFHRSPRAGHRLAIHQEPGSRAARNTTLATGHRAAPVPVPTSSRVLGSSPQNILIVE